MLSSAKSVNSSSVSYSIFTTPEQSIETQKKYLYCCEQVEQLHAGSTYKMSTHAVACFFEVVVHSQNRLIDGVFLDNGKRKSATRESLADDFKRIWADIIA